MAALTAYVRKTGDDTNGGSSASTSPDKSGTDGVTNGTTTFTSAAALFAAGDVDKLIMIGTKSRYRIVGYTNTTTITLSGSPSAGSGLTWKIGGAVLTLGSLVEAATSTSGVIAGGDIIWIGPGVYREIIADVVWTSPASEVQINGDVSGQYTGDAPGPVILTNYLTSFTSAPTATQMWTPGSAKNYLTWQNLVFISAGGAQCLGFNTGTNITVRNCAFIHASSGTGTAIGGTVNYGVDAAWLIDRCWFYKSSSAGCVTANLTTGVGADYDANIVVQNSVFVGLGSVAVGVVAVGTSANKGGGVIVRNCYSNASAILQTLTATHLSTSIPCQLLNSVGPSVAAATSGQITENYNILTATTPRTNVTAGANSVSDGSRALMLHFGQERVWGGSLRDHAEPMDLSGMLGFGNDGSETATDIRGTGHIRPAGGVSALPAVGAMERSNTFAKNTSTVRTGTNSISITGPGYQEFLVPVDASSTTISVYVQWDATYAGTKPQLQIDANGEIGVTAETKTATGLSGSWEQVTLSAFTPTAKGIVTIRVLSNDTNGAGQMFVDDFAIA